MTLQPVWLLFMQKLGLKFDQSLLHNIRWFDLSRIFTEQKWKSVIAKNNETLSSSSQQQPHN